MKFWTYAIKQRITGRDYSEIFDWAGSVFEDEYPDLENTTILKACWKLTRTQQDFQECVENDDHCDALLTKRAEAMEKAGHGTVALNITAMHNAEKLANQF